MNPQQPEIMLQFCKAMADESRLKIIVLLPTAAHSVHQPASILELKEPTVSHHLGMLKQLDLVRLRAYGNFRWYRLNEEVLGQIRCTGFSRDTKSKIPT